MRKGEFIHYGDDETFDHYQVLRSFDVDDLRAEYSDDRLTFVEWMCVKGYITPLDSTWIDLSQPRRTAAAMLDKLRDRKRERITTA